MQILPVVSAQDLLNTASNLRESAMDHAETDAFSQMLHKVVGQSEQSIGKDLLGQDSSAKEQNEQKSSQKGKGAGKAKNGDSENFGASKDSEDSMDIMALFASMAQAPYNPIAKDPSALNNSDEIRYTPKEVRLLIKSMKEAGVDESALKALEECSGLPGGPTIKQMAQALALAGEPAAQSFTQQEQLRLQGICQSLLDKDGSLLQSLQFGDSRTAMQALSQRLDALKTQGTPITLEQGDMALLGKALKLSPANVVGMDMRFGSAPARTFRPEQVEALLADGKHEIKLRAQAQDKSLHQLHSNSGVIEQMAQSRITLEENASARESSSTAHRRAFIEDKAFSVGRDIQAKQANPEAEVGANVVKAGDSPRHGDATQGQDSLLSGGLGQEKNSRNFLGQNGQEGQNGRNDPNFAHDDPRQATRKNEKTSSQVSGEKSLAASSLLSFGQATVSGTATVAAQANIPANLPAASREQIEQAILSANHKNTQKIEIMLNPLELGKLSVTLTSRNGEISALIQPEKAETTSLILQQAEQIRAHLESQGIRVEKVEVRTALSDGQSQNWNGTDQHNSQQQQSARQEELTWLRRINRDTLRGQKGDQDDLARNMQDGMQSTRTEHNAAKLSASGLHLVA